MVVDPYTALSLASGLVQFVDFGTRLSFKIYEIYHSASGLTSTQSEIMEMAQRFQTMADRVSRIPLINDGDATVIADHESFQSLLISCKTRATELIDMIEGLKTDKTHRLWSSVRQGLRAARKKEDIERVVNNMKTLHESLNTYLLALLRLAKTVY